MEGAGAVWAVNGNSEKKLKVRNRNEYKVVEREWKKQKEIKCEEIK